MFLGLFVLDLWANTCQTHHVTSRPYPLTLLVMVHHGHTGLRPPHTKFEVRRPFRSEDITHFRSQHYVGLVTLTFVFDIETGAHYCPWGGQPSYQFWCF